MEDLLILGRDDDRYLFKQFLGHYDVPAYVRRAVRVQEVYRQLVHRCQSRREEWLATVRTRLAMLHALAGEWTALRTWLADESQLQVLHEMHFSLEPQLRVPVGPTTSGRQLRRALHELTESIGRFNARWHEFLRGVDLSPINELRDGYNRYYLLEKECAMRSAQLARQGFERLEPLTHDELMSLLPPLPVPRIKE
jgi:hypothetical protein